MLTLKLCVTLHSDAKVALGVHPVVSLHCLSLPYNFLALQAAKVPPLLTPDVTQSCVPPHVASELVHYAAHLALKCRCLANLADLIILSFHSTCCSHVANVMQASLRSSVQDQRPFPYTEDQLKRPLEDLLHNRMHGAHSTNAITSKWLSPIVTQDPECAVALAQKPVPPSAAGALAVATAINQVAVEGSKSKLWSLSLATLAIFCTVFVS